MKFCKRCNSEKELNDFCRNKTSKDGLQAYCRNCTRAFSAAARKADPAKEAQRLKAWREANPEKAAAISAAWKAANPERVSASNREWYENNRELRHTQVTEWAKANPEKRRQACRKWYARNTAADNLKSQKWREANPEKAAALAAKRRSAKLQRTPKWLTESDFAAISEFFTRAAELSAATGEAYEVDHIIPLQGKRVSGLHIPANLQILTATENCKKGNRWTPE